MKSILILSENDDLSTTNVMRWISYLDHSVQIIRLTPELLYDSFISFSNIDNPIILTVKDLEFSTNDVNVVWLRKWHFEPSLFEQNIDEIFTDNGQSLSIKCNLREEFGAFYKFFIFKLGQNNCIYWFNHPQFNYNNKLENLIIAKEIGLSVPATFLSSSLDNFPEENFISKHMANCFSIYHRNNPYTTFTSKVQNKKQQNFFISLFQKEIVK